MKKIFIALILFLIFIQSVGAEITNPYTLDEKDQIIFGDSTQVSTYLGLENYTHDYVGGYLHITFTYTHSNFSFSAYPPSLYVTALDPRATTTPTVRFSQPIYTLSHQTTNFTDWYSYDVQFDVAGYVAIVKQAGVTEVFNARTDIPGLILSDWAALANQFPRQNPLDNKSVAFTPLPIQENIVFPEPEVPDPVIIIPGIMGSAYKNGQLVIDPILHTYDDLIATLIANGYVEGEDLFTFPYEWRDSNVFSANLLDEKIEQIKTICGCSKVDLVAHSMGGLVTRSYIQSGDYDGDVDQLIFLGTPHKGAPTAYLQWEAGKFPRGLDNDLTQSFFQAEAIKNGYSNVFNYIHDRPILSIQELLPTFSYLKDASTGLLRQYPNNYPQNVFLENLNNKISNLLDSGVEVTNMVGDSGENKTIERIRVVPTDHAVFWQHGEPEGFGAVIGDNGLERGQGDNTVTTGASGLDGFGSEEVSASHNRIPTVAENKIVKILTGKDSTTNIDTGSNTDVKVLLLQLLSPIDVVVTAPDSKRIGKNFSNDTEYNEIPDAFYSGFQTDNEYITILNPLDGEYRVEVQGTDSGGEYGVLTSYVSEEFATTTETMGITEPGQITNLEVQVNNVNPEDIVVEREITLEILINDINGAYNLGWIKDKKIRDELIKKVQKIYKHDKKMDKKLSKALKLDLKLYRKEKINEQAYNLIKTDLEWLINH